MRNTKELVHAPRELGDRFKRYTERVCFRKRSIKFFEARQRSKKEPLIFRVLPRGR